MEEAKIIFIIAVLRHTLDNISQLLITDIIYINAVLDIKLMEYVIYINSFYLKTAHLITIFFFKLCT